MRFLDIMDFSADKGVGVKELQTELGILPAETMVFGDYYNDEPLLQSAEYAFIMDAAPLDLKEKYKYNGDISFTHRPVLELCLQVLVHFFRLGYKDQAGGRHVKSVHDHRSGCFGIHPSHSPVDGIDIRFSGD